MWNVCRPTAHNRESHVYVRCMVSKKIKRLHCSIAREHFVKFNRPIIESSMVKCIHRDKTALVFLQI